MNDLNKKSAEELKKLEEESRAELFALRFQSAMGNLEKPHRIGELKKQIAWILTILYIRKNAGENTEINVKINLSETYAKIEKESQAFAKQRKEKIEQMMAEQQADDEQMPNLIDLPLTDTIDLTASAAVDKQSPTTEQPTSVVDKKPGLVKITSDKKDVVEKKSATIKEAVPPMQKKVLEVKKVADKAPKADKDVALKTLIKENDDAKKSAAKSKKTSTNDKETVTVKSVTSAKAEIEVLHGEKKTGSTNDVKKPTELNVKEKLAAIKSSVVVTTGDTTKGRGSNIKIDLDLKRKDPNAKEYTYGANWKENRDKILTAGKTTKKAVDKTTKKSMGKNNGKK
ncbi:50S ribosomal protein L29 [Spiroplasma endosymbiont of Polydrusus formosus]|uniref:50S ribosomal protein L29 n=1 Tax=Spiroplasma endosymbiont of Polydrusus formosus TaxID=3139326 RepID=UPI0035B54746